MYIRQISIYVENKEGKLADITEFLAEKNINLRALSIADTKEFGVLRVIVDKPEYTMSLLKAEGYTCVITDMLAVQLKDEPGAMAKIMRILADRHIDVEYTYAFPTADKTSAVLVFKVANNAEAEVALADTDFTVKGSEILEA